MFLDQMLDLNLNKPFRNENIEEKVSMNLKNISMHIVAIVVVVAVVVGLEVEAVSESIRANK